jgi:uncharacterized protein YggU (UPF0235/DUF167 family)
MRLAVRVHPRASRERLSWDGEAVSVWVTAPAAGGRATEAAARAIAGWLGVPRRQVELLSGVRARSKVFEVGEARLPAATAGSA